MAGVGPKKPLLAGPDEGSPQRRIRQLPYPQQMAQEQLLLHWLQHEALGPGLQGTISGHENAEEEDWDVPGVRRGLESAAETDAVAILENRVQDDGGGMSKPGEPGGGFGVVGHQHLSA